MELVYQSVQHICKSFASERGRFGEDTLLRPTHHFSLTPDSELEDKPGGAAQPAQRGADTPETSSLRQIQMKKPEQSAIPDSALPGATRLVLTAAETGLAAQVSATLQDQLARQGLPLAAEVVALADAVLHGDTTAHLLLVFRAAPQSVTLAQAAGADPAAALVTWLAGAEEILRLARRHGRQCTVLEATATLALPGPALAAIAARLGAPPPKLPMTAKLSEPAPPAPLFRLLAHLVVGQSFRAQAVQAELEALAVPLGLVELDLDALMHACLAQGVQARAEVAAARQQAETAARDLVAASAERDRHFREMARLTVELNQRDDEFARREAERRADQDKERRLLLEQLIDLESRSEGHFKTALAAEAEVATHAGLLSAAQQNRDATLADLEAARARADDLQRQISALEAGREALEQASLTGLGRIAAVEVAWVDAQTRLETAVAEQTALQIALDSVKADKSHLTDDLAQTRATDQLDKAELLARIERMQAELDTIYRSRSWKVTAPLRGIRRTLGTAPND